MKFKQFKRRVKGAWSILRGDREQIDIDALLAKDSEERKKRAVEAISRDRIDKEYNGPLVHRINHIPNAGNTTVYINDVPYNSCEGIFIDQEQRQGHLSLVSTPEFPEVTNILGKNVEIKAISKYEDVDKEILVLKEDVLISEDCKFSMSQNTPLPNVIVNFSTK